MGEKFLGYSRGMIVDKDTWWWNNKMQGIIARKKKKFKKWNY